MKTKCSGTHFGFKNNKQFSTLTNEQFCALLSTISIKIPKSKGLRLAGYVRGPFEKFVDWRQCAAVMQREA
jgi:hypothetical protein